MKSELTSTDKSAANYHLQSYLYSKKENNLHRMLSESMLSENIHEAMRNLEASKRYYY
jgi:hypothetical protein